MMRKALWTLPILAIGIGIGWITLPHAFASSNPQLVMAPQAQQMMQQGLNTPQGQAMVQVCNNYMSQYGQPQK